MPIIICPQCDQRVGVPIYGTSSHLFNDIVHECNSGRPAIDEEDVLRVGNYIDEAHGVTTEQKVPNANLQGLPNKFQGTRAGIEGANLEQLTVRGNSTALYRTRRRLKYIDLTKIRPK